MASDRIAENTVPSVGTGNITLNGAKSNSRTVASAYTVGDRVPYILIDGDGVGFEIGEAPFLESNILDRANAIIETSSNSDELISLSNNAHEVFVPVTLLGLSQTALVGVTGGTSAHPQRYLRHLAPASHRVRRSKWRRTSRVQFSSSVLHGESNDRRRSICSWNRSA